MQGCLQVKHLVYDNELKGFWKRNGRLLDTFGFGIEGNKTFWIQNQTIEEEVRHLSAVVTRGYYISMTSDDRSMFEYITCG